MAVTSGFFNSVNHDRLYNAEQISSMFDGIILDGIYQGLGDAFIVKPYSDLNCTVTVGTGRAWFDHTWTLNSTELALTLDDPNVLYDRIDAIVIDVDRRQDVRENSIKVVKGTVSETGATKPSLIEEELHNQYPLAYVTVKAGSVAPIQAQYIENVIGQTKTPLVAGVLEHMDITMFVQQMEDEFNVWFEGLKDVVSGDSITNLQQQINDINEYIELQKPVSIDGLSYEKAQNSTITITNLGPAKSRAVILPDGYVFYPYNKSESSAPNYSIYGKIYNLDSVSISDTALNASVLWDTSGDYVWFDLIYADADQYPVHLCYYGIYQHYDGSYQRVYIRVVNVTITSDHVVSASVANTSSNLKRNNLEAVTSDTTTKLRDGSYICSILVNADFPDDTGIIAKISSDGVISKEVATDAFPANSREHDPVFGVYSSSNISVQEKIWIGVNGGYSGSYGWVSADPSTLVAETTGSPSVPVLQYIAKDNDAYIVKDDKKSIARYNGSMSAKNVGSVRPSIAISSTLEGGATFSGYKGAISSSDQKVVLVNYSNSLIGGLSLGGGLLSWTPSKSGNALGSQSEVNSTSFQPLTQWSNESIYRWIIPGKLVQSAGSTVSPKLPYVVGPVASRNTSSEGEYVGRIYMLTLKLGD